MIQRIKGFFKKQEPINIKALPAGGHSSEDPTMADTIQGMAAHYTGLQPEVAFESIPVMRTMNIYHPDFGKAVTTFKAIANPGHKLTVTGPGKVIDAALQELNDLASRFYKYGAGADGLINHMLDEVCLGGVPSYEDSLYPDFSGVKEPLIIPPEEIRFRLYEGEIVPFQVNTAAIDGVRLNPHTYHYYPLMRSGRSPYAIPPPGNRYRTRGIPNADISGPQRDDQKDVAVGP